MLIIVGSGFWIKRVCTDYVKRRKTSTCLQCGHNNVYNLEFAVLALARIMCAHIAILAHVVLLLRFESLFALPLLSVIAMSCRRYT